MCSACTRAHIPKLFGDDGGISQPPAGTVTPVDLLKLERSTGMYSSLVPAIGSEESVGGNRNNE